MAPPEAAANALALAPTEDRPQLLTARCGDDPELQAEVEALLPYLGAPTPSPAGDLEAALEEKLAERFVGKAFGPYTIQRLLGRGGFSRVFLATRSFEGQERTYAVKVPLGGSFAEEAARYRLEIAVLSQLRHPNIAGLVDVVPGPDDRPLLVIDYVEGAQPITLAAAGAGLPTRRRIELFLKVLSALSAAHERGVIHCDLSAANVVRGKLKARRQAQPTEPLAPGPGEAASPPPASASPSLAALRRGWAQLLRRVYEIEPLVCPRCQGVMRVVASRSSPTAALMRVVAFITDGRVIRRILDHLNASARRATQDRAPPPTAAVLVAPIFP